MSEQLKLPTDVVERILKARDALVMHDRDEAYHQLYAIASPRFDKYFPWDEMEKQINYPRFNDEEIIARKEFDGRHFKPQGPIWVRANDRLPGWDKLTEWRFAGKEPIAKETVRFLFSAANLHQWEWYDESPAEQPVAHKLLTSYEKFFKDCWPRLIDREVTDVREINSAWEVHKRREGLMEAEQPVREAEIFAWLQKTVFRGDSRINGYTVPELVQLFKEQKQSPAEWSGEKEAKP